VGCTRRGVELTPSTASAENVNHGDRMRGVQFTESTTESLSESKTLEDDLISLAIRTTVPSKLSALEKRSGGIHAGLMPTQCDAPASNNAAFTWGRPAASSCGVRRDQLDARRWLGAGVQPRLAPCGKGMSNNSTSAACLAVGGPPPRWTPGQARSVRRA